MCVIYNRIIERICGIYLFENESYYFIIYMLNEINQKITSIIQNNVSFQMFEFYFDV